MSAQHNIADGIKSGSALAPQLLANGATAGIAIDRSGFNGLLIRFDAGAKDCTTLTSINAKLQHGATATPATDVESTDIGYGDEDMTQIVAENTGAEMEIDLRGLLQYVRIYVTAVLAGGNTACQASATYILFDPIYPKPVA